MIITPFLFQGVIFMPTMGIFEKIKLFICILFITNTSLVYGAFIVEPFMGNSTSAIIDYTVRFKIPPENKDTIEWLKQDKIENLKEYDRYNQNEIKNLNRELQSFARERIYNYKASFAFNKDEMIVKEDKTNPKAISYFSNNEKANKVEYYCATNNHIDRASYKSNTYNPYGLLFKFKKGYSDLFERNTTLSIKSTNNEYQIKVKVQNEIKINYVNADYLFFYFTEPNQLNQIDYLRSDQLIASLIIKEYKRDSNGIFPSYMIIRYQRDHNRYETCELNFISSKINQYIDPTYFEFPIIKDITTVTDNRFEPVLYYRINSDKDFTDEELTQNFKEHLNNTNQESPGNTQKNNHEKKTLTENILLPVLKISVGVLILLLLAYGYRKIRREK